MHGIIVNRDTMANIQKFMSSAIFRLFLRFRKRQVFSVILVFSMLAVIIYVSIKRRDFSNKYISKSIVKQKSTAEKKCASMTNKSQPNVVFLLADDFGWNDIGYHSSTIRTPHLDRLANIGVKLENYYVQPICSPSRSQLMTGRYQIRYGMQHSVLRNDRPHGLPLDEVTLPQILREYGYSTHIVGKWHLGFFKKEYLPLHRGFDTFYGFLGGGGDYWTHKVPNEKAEPPETYRALDLWDQSKAVLDQNGSYSTHLFVNKAVEIISRHEKNKGAFKVAMEAPLERHRRESTVTTAMPMFLYLPFQAVHAPLEAPDVYINQYKHIKSSNMRMYAAVATVMDEAVGNLTHALKANGKSHNGASKAGSNWPLRGFKNTLWEGGVRGVGFVSSPLLKSKGTTSDALIHISDWFPRIVRLAGGSTDDKKPLDGFDVWDTKRPHPAKMFEMFFRKINEVILKKVENYCLFTHIKTWRKRCCLANYILHFSEGKASPRTEILHNINPLIRQVNSKSLKVENHNIFDTSTRAAIRSGDWKLITGKPGMLFNYITKFKSFVANSATDAFCHFQEILVQDLTNKLFEKSTDTKFKDLWLFNIRRDPQERRDLSEECPEIVQKLLERLSEYNKTAVPPYWPDPDQRSNPALHGDVIGPWL
ncbi:arylsulfatase B-like [Branchiostoma floridae]|uniref:Arylsulfatase B-like n=1 Tax=Branchiostoma floridae TaxID=7739 RepID=A0A9J7LS03_BRAFL|nr:arylsulfatase B-like [Branchiostoma floridae]